MSEIAVVSSRRLRLQKLVDAGSRGAKTALELSEHPSRFLSTVQVGITLIGIFNGAFGEAALVDKLTPTLSLIPWVGDYAEELSLGLVVIGITFASLIFGELVPKRIAMQYPETIATVMSGPMVMLSKLMAPFVRVLTLATEGTLKVLRVEQKRDDTVTEEELHGLLQEGSDAGVIEQTEHEIVSRALKLDDTRVASLMTPRLDVHAIDLDGPHEETLQTIANSPYTRFPVFKGDFLHMVGVVHSGTLYERQIKGLPLDIAAAMQQPLFVPATISAMQLLETLKKHRTELALVVDEYGELEGIVTLSDVLGALVGDVAVIDESEEPDAVQRDDGSWLIDGGVSLQRFSDILGEGIAFPEEDAGSYHTLAGFVITHLGRIPSVAEHFEWSGYRFEVVDMDRNRVDRVMVGRAVLVPEPTE